MYQIGKFARMNNISLHTLRWYDNIGILKSHKKDEYSPFRYYTDDDIRILDNIHILQKFGFSIDEIKNLSKDIVKSKINAIKEKINFFNDYIYLLQILILEENMEKLNLKETFKKIPPQLMTGLCGEWSCLGKSKDFRQISSWPDINSKLEKVNSNKQLFIGENNSIKYITNCNELSQVYEYFNHFYLNNVKYKFAFIGYNLMVWKDNCEANELEFYLYQRISDYKYTKDELNTIIDKTQRKKIDELTPASEELKSKLLGEWNFNDITIFESDINNYPNIKKEVKYDFGPWKPHYAYLKFNNDQTVQTMKDDESLEICDRKLNAKNTISKYYNNFIIDSTFNTKAKLFFTIKTIDNDDYLFLASQDTLSRTELDDTYWVYKKV